MTIDPTVFLYGVLTGLGYAVLSMLQAFAEGESFDGASFLKTLVLSLISSGVVSSTTGNVFLVIASSGVIVITLDKVINTLRNLYDTGTTTGTTSASSAPAPASPAPSTPSKSL